jgi:hypothetical protein
MLKVVKKSQAFKTTDCAITYRSGDNDVFGTCPKICPLNPNQTVSTGQVDWDYLDAVLDATVRGGRSWTYSHFKFEDISFKQNKRFYFNFLYRIRDSKYHTTINRSTDDIDEAVAVHNKGYPTVVTLSDKNVSKNFVHKEVKFVRCLAEYNEKVGCINCDLCARKNRDFVIVFYGHGSQKKLVGEEEQGGCYGTGGKVRLHWEHTKNVSQSLNDINKLKQFVQELPYGTILRHHIVGDVGKENNKLAVQNKI